MICFTMELASIPVGVTVNYEKTKEFCKNYLVENKTPEFCVEVNEADIEAERQKSDAELRREGVESAAFPAAYLETLALYRKLLPELLKRDIFLFHGAAVEVDGEAYLFTAPSGTGKTTHLRLWQKKFGDRLTVVNGDKPLIAIRDGKAIVCGTPWQGKENYGENRQAPLKALCFLSRAEVNRIEPTTLRDELAFLMGQIYRPSDAASMVKTLSLVNAMGEAVSLYHLYCNMEQDAADVAYNGMQGN